MGYFSFLLLLFALKAKQRLDTQPAASTGPLDSLEFCSFAANQDHKYPSVVGLHLYFCVELKIAHWLISRDITSVVLCLSSCSLCSSLLHMPEPRVFSCTEPFSDAQNLRCWAWLILLPCWGPHSGDRAQWCQGPDRTQPSQEWDACCCCWSCYACPQLPLLLRPSVLGTSHFACASSSKWDSYSSTPHSGKGSLCAVAVPWTQSCCSYILDQILRKNKRDKQNIDRCFGNKVVPHLSLSRFILGRGCEIFYGIRATEGIDSSASSFPSSCWAPCAIFERTSCQETQTFKGDKGQWINECPCFPITFFFFFCIQDHPTCN